MPASLAAVDDVAGTAVMSVSELATSCSPCPVRPKLARMLHTAPGFPWPPPDGVVGRHADRRLAGIVTGTPE
ncbi:hypothetical protein VA596_47220 [Amycolatopsis sp., V23-08]|uniref:Uncharacterized protein n=1 Tax=Amycolatopsis heterodermiae TaxID=3110235 RepID=A0ABU5RN15_9PSEU|nr:hypothetical protein [Amycolatopsis sp., V23-08]MEA5367190.1 hypothetical protein [Amycolatopsis sp., V23-08]